MKSSFTLLSLLAAFNSGNAQMGTCPTSCIVTASDGTVFDLSGLKGHTMKTTSDSGDGYSFTLCGTDPTQCPNDPGGVFTGMAVQKRSAGSGCYVLAVYDQQDSCQWSPNEPGSNAELTLIMQDGSSQDCMGQDRSLAVEFSCPKDKSALIPSTFTATNPTGTCDYVYKVETCAVCPGGCLPTSCCQAKPTFPNYKKICNQVKNKTLCSDTTTGYGSTCQWTCGECDANKGKEQYQQFCLQEITSSSCGLLNSTCHWTPLNI